MIFIVYKYAGFLRLYILKYIYNSYKSRIYKLGTFELNL